MPIICIRKSSNTISVNFLKSYATAIYLQVNYIILHYLFVLVSFFKETENLLILLLLYQQDPANTYTHIYNIHIYTISFIFYVGYLLQNLVCHSVVFFT